MRFQFKTSYNQDIRLFKDKVDASWYGLLAVAVLALPLLMSDYYVGEATWVFIYAICGVSLMVLVGYTGLVSLGHAAFLGIGAYAHAYFLQHGIPWVVSVVLAIALTTASGIIVGLPALRMTGIYLAIATLAFAVIIQEATSEEVAPIVMSVYGLTEQDISEQLTSQSRILKFVDLRFRGLVRVDKSAIDAYYQEKLLPELRKRGAAEPKLADVSDRIENILVERRIDELLVNWLQTLRSQAHIEKMLAGSATASTGATP